jgi:hypothetical protein
MQGNSCLFSSWATEKSSERLQTSTTNTSDVWPYGVPGATIGAPILRPDITQSSVRGAPLSAWISIQLKPIATAVTITPGYLHPIRRVRPGGHEFLELFRLVTRHAVYSGADDLPGVDERLKSGIVSERSI